MAFDVESSCPCFWDSLIYVSRAWGLLTGAVLSGVGMDLSYHGHSIGTCVLIGSAIVFVLEIAWAILLLFHVFPRRGGGRLEEGPMRKRCGVLLKWCERPSRKGVLYAVLGAVVLLWPHQHLWLSPVAGAMLILLATFNLLLTLKSRGAEGDSLLPSTMDDGFDRLDDVSDDSLASDATPWRRQAQPPTATLVGPAQQHLGTTTEDEAAVQGREGTHLV